MLTTDYIVDETLTLLRARRDPERALALGHDFFEGGLTRLYFLTEDDIRRSWETFRRFADKGWSFTDCTSKVVMEDLGIAHAFAFDDDFR